MLQWWLGILGVLGGLVAFLALVKCVCYWNKPMPFLDECAWAGCCLDVAETGLLLDMVAD